MSMRDSAYAPLPKERDTLSGPTQFVGAYDGKALFDRQKPVPGNVVNKHDGGSTPANDGERALDIAMGRRSFAPERHEG
jgi:hypothetical protein